MKAHDITTFQREPKRNEEASGRFSDKVTAVIWEHLFIKSHQNEEHAHSCYYLVRKDELSRVKFHSTILEKIKLYSS